MENEDYPDVVEAIEALEAWWIDLIDQGQASPSILDEATLARSPEFFAETRLKEPDWLDIVCRLLILV